MVSILKREFWDSFKSIRSILILIFFTFISYKSAKFWDNNPQLVKSVLSGEKGESIYTSVIILLILLFGFLLAFAISHDTMSSEMELKTIRLLVTKTSKFNIVAGKMLGSFLFWVLTLSISFVIISCFAGAFFFQDYLRLVALLLYIVCFVLFVSSLIPRAKVTMFIGIFLGILLPVLNLFSIALNKWYLIPFKFLLPFYYLVHSIGYIFIVIALAITLFAATVLVTYRKDF